MLETLIHMDPFTGWFHPSYWELAGITLLLTHVTIVSVTVFLHRCHAHRAVQLHPAVAHFFRFWLWLTTGMVTKQWVAVHRKHHAKCETPEDPHSPQVHGIHKILWTGVLLYIRETRVPETMERYGVGTPDDWMERNVYSRSSTWGITLLAFIDVACFGPYKGLVVWAVQMVWVPFWAAGVVNGWGHWFGYRNHALEDASVNILPWGLIIGGEELHNNHHASPTSARFSSKWYEIDAGWLYIRLLAWLGLAKIRPVAAAPG